MVIQLAAAATGIFLLSFSVSATAKNICAQISEPAISSVPKIEGKLHLEINKNQVLSPDGKLILELPKDCEASLFKFSGDGKRVLNFCDNTVTLLPEKKVIHLKKHGISVNTMLPDGFLYQEKKGGSLVKVDPISLTSEIIAGPAKLNACGYTVLRNGKKILHLKTQTVEIGSGDPEILCSTDGEQVFLRYEDGSLRSVRNNGALVPIPNMSSERDCAGEIQISNQGHYRALCDEKILTFDQNGKLLDEIPSGPIGGLVGFDIGIGELWDGIYSVQGLKSLCAAGEYSLVSKCDCDADTDSDFDPILNSVACQSPLNSDIWKKVRQPPPKTLTEKQVLFYLKRMQKPGGFDIQTEGSFVLASIEFAGSSDLIASEIRNTLAVIALQNRNSGFIKEIYHQRPDLRKRSVDFKSNPLCLSDKERKKAGQSARELIEGFVIEDPKSTERLWALSPFLQTLPLEEREELVEKLADARARDVRERSGISDSTSYYAAKNLLKPFFALPGKTLFDTQFIRSQDSAQVVYFANAPFTSDSGKSAREVASGLYALKQPVDLKKGSRVETKISLDGETYVTKAQIEPLAGKASDYVNTAHSLNYKELWKDKQLNGFLFAGSNIVDEPTSADEFLNRYRAYYADQGFQFSEQRPVTDIQELILDGVEKGDIDYLIKDAHKGGDVHTIGEINKQGILIQGSRQDPASGRSEKITIFYPRPTGEEVPDAILRSDLAQALAKRKQKKGDKPFIFFNNSCEGVGTILSDIAQIQDKNFITIATVGDATDFTPIPWSPLRQIIHGIRNEKSYSDIRQMMKANPNFEKESRNHYLLPDDPLFKKMVIDQMIYPAKETIGITRNGKPYSFSRELRSNH